MIEFSFNYLEIILIFMGGDIDDNSSRKWKLESNHVYATMKTELGCYLPMVRPVYTNEISLSGCVRVNLK